MNWGNWSSAKIIPPFGAAGSSIIPVGSSLGLQTNLSAFFSLDNTLADATGTVTNLTNNNTVTFVSPPAPLPAVTNCANFVAASSQYLSHADATGLNVVGVDFSLQVWLYYTGSAKPFLSKNSGTFGNREYEAILSFITSGNQIRFKADDNAQTTSGTNLAASAWIHVVFTWTVSTKLQQIYINGSFAASSNGANPTAGTSEFRIGTDGGLSGFLSGNMALVGTWRNRILSSSDVSLLYNSGNGLSYAAMA